LAALGLLLAQCPATSARQAVPTLLADECALSRFSFVGLKNQLNSLPPPALEVLDHLALAWQRIGGPVIIVSRINTEEAASDPSLGDKRADQIRSLLIARGVLPESIWVRVQPPHSAPVSSDIVDTESGATVSAKQISMDCLNSVSDGFIEWIWANCIESSAASKQECKQVLTSLQKTSSRHLGD